MFQYWKNTTDTPSVTIKINLWSFLNFRVWKTKLSSTLLYYILNLKNMNAKTIKIYENLWNFFTFYNILIRLLFISLFILIFFI